MNRLVMPSIDLTNFDLTNIDLTKFDPRKIDLKHVDLSSLDPGRLPRPDRRAAELARDLTYVAIGFSVLGFQRLQVHRRDLEKTVQRLRRSSSTSADQP